jgi:outer membrane protein TolC
MLLRRPDIQQAELELAAARADVEAARAAFLPSFTITPYAGFHTRSLPSLLRTPQSLVLGFLGGLTAPIFQNRIIRSDFDRSVALNQEAFYNYQQRILRGHQEVVSHLQRVENYKEVYELRVQETEVLLSAVSTSNDLFMAGYATYLEVITAQARVLEAELEMTTTRKEIFLSVVDLYRALGGGWQ